MRHSVIGLLALILALRAVSQESPELHACMNTARAQNEMNQCASDESARADAELNRTYQRLLAMAKQSTGAREKIEKSERAWIQFRDAYMAAMYPAEDKQASYGSIFPMEFDLLEADLTRAQTKRLTDLINQYDEEAQ